MEVQTGQWLHFNNYMTLSIFLLNVLSFALAGYMKLVGTADTIKTYVLKLATVCNLTIKFHANFFF